MCLDMGLMVYQRMPSHALFVLYSWRKQGLGRYFIRENLAFSHRRVDASLCMRLCVDGEGITTLIPDLSFYVGMFPRLGE